MRADTIRPGMQNVAARAEHISIEADPDDSLEANRPQHRITRFSYQHSSPLRGRLTELAILDGHYLNVRSVRPRSAPLRYQFDLRFASAQPVRVRSIAWPWLIVTLVLATMGAVAIAVSMTPGVAPWTSTGVLGGVAAILGAIGVGLQFLRQTTESLEFRSAHGGASLVCVTGGIGSTRAGKAFFVELIKSINAARLERPQSRQQFLRDEMREHHRLRELGALSEEQYEASKARILAAY